jgi:hypothetical protein
MKNQPTQPLERHPERRREPDGRKAAVLEPAHAGHERAVIDGERRRHEDDDADRDGIDTVV